MWRCPDVRRPSSGGRQRSVTGTSTTFTKAQRAALSTKSEEHGVRVGLFHQYVTPGGQTPRDPPGLQPTSDPNRNSLIPLDTLTPRGHRLRLQKCVPSSFMWMRARTRLGEGGGSEDQQGLDGLDGHHDRLMRATHQTQQ
ncbi:hypothetical protein EYF80_033924 [Liparis tanakae]|uniref:Uncharacterized protein n=1 Tax=Liparis tanakae TaxID=230148 RepID=A0A4Z2GQV3_9TELE|nr:hypothetical protein EYF80_033924 [Liparis tanakae]